MTRNSKVLLYTLGIGWIAHGYRLTNYMLNADGTNYLTSIGASWVTSLGRFLLPVVEKLRGGYELPLLIGMIALFLLAGSVRLLAELFDLKSDLSLFLLAGICVANPVVTSIFSYMYTADGYMLSLFFSVLAVYLLQKLRGWKGLALGSLALFISLGFYQAFLSVTILLAVFILILMLLQPENTLKNFFLQCGRFASMGVLGVAAYYGVMRLVWHFGGYGVTSYMGMDQQGGGFSLLQALKDCYIDFARYFLVRYQINCYNVMNVLMFLLLGISLCYIVTKKKLWKQPARWLFGILLLAMLPVAGFIFEFTSQELSYSSTSMEYSMNLIYLLPILLWEQFGIGEGTLKEWKCAGYWRKYLLWTMTVLLSAGILFHFTVISNQAYRSIERANTKLMLTLNRVQSRMELQEGYHENMQVAVLGSLYEIPEYVYAAPMMSGVVSNIFLTEPSEYINYMNWTMGTSYSWAGKDRMEQLVHTQEFQSMKQWPEENSVQVIDGTMVLFLSDNNLDELGIFEE